MTDPENPVHMVRFRCDAEADDFLIESFIPQYLTNLQAWDHELHDSNDPPTLVNVADDPTEEEELEYRTDWRFDFDEDEEVFLENLWGHVIVYTDWAEMKYHVCDHGDDERTGCAWDDTKERVHGSPP